MNKINKNICEITFVYSHYMDVGIIHGFDEVGRNEAEDIIFQLAVNFENECGDIWEKGLFPDVFPFDYYDTIELYASVELLKIFEKIGE